MRTPQEARYALFVVHPSSKPDPTLTPFWPQLQVMARKLEIMAYSSEPGLRCALCRSIGYPTTNGAVLDARYPLAYDAPARRRWFRA